MKQISTFLTCLTVIFALSFQTFAQTTVQSPEEFLNFKKGERFLRHHQVVSYYEYIARQFPNQVKLVQYGSTNEGRPLMVAIVASPENFIQLEEIRTNNLKSMYTETNLVVQIQLHSSYTNF
jgi:hypothetical protein